MGEDTQTRNVGALASLAMRQSVTVEENAVRRHDRWAWLTLQTIGSALLELGSSASTSTALAIQAIDGIVDIYSDEQRAYDAPVFRQRDFLSQLNALVPTLRARVRAAADRTPS